jgi:hypothetical protein
MSEKKRKATAQVSERPSKKPPNATSVKVIHHGGSDLAKPIIGKSMTVFQLNGTATKKSSKYSGQHATE